MKTIRLLLLVTLTSVLARAQTFAQPAGSPFATGTYPVGVVAADFNNDGKPDLAIANSNSTTVTVLLGNGTGGFTAASGSPVFVGMNPSSIAAGDCNRDGIVDLTVTTAGLDAHVVVLLGNGLGGFTQAAGSPYTVGTATSVILADFNRDSYLDFATSNSNSVSLFLGNGAGRFTASASGPFTTGNGIRSMVVGDFNHDGNPDLATANYNFFSPTDKSFTILLGNGVGAFTTVTTSLPLAAPSVNQIVTADLNGDGKSDLAIVSADNQNITTATKILIFLGDGSGGFAAAAGSPFAAAGNGGYSLAVADFNGDGKPDLAVVNSYSSNVAILLGDGAGGFFASSSGPFAVNSVGFIITGDWNGDGKPDLAISGGYIANNVTVLLNTTPPTPQTRIGFYYNGYFALDANGDGSFNGAPTDKFFIYITPQPGDIAVTGDWNGDGRTKIGIYRSGFWILDYNGNGAYDYDGTDSGDRFYGFGGPTSQGYLPVVGDWNGDGKSKVGFYNQGFWALDYNGDGTFQSGVDKFYGFGGRPNEVPLVGDWNHNGKTKVGSFASGSFLLDYNGDGAFNAAVDKYFMYLTYTSSDKPVIGDWSGNGSTKVGIYRDGFWILDYNGDGVYQGTDKFYGFGGNPGEVPVTGDWNGSGFTKVGVNINGFWQLDYNGNGSWDGTSTDRFYGFGGNAGEQPLTGKWQ